MIRFISAVQRYQPAQKFQRHSLHLVWLGAALLLLGCQFITGMVTEETTTPTPSQTSSQTLSPTPSTTASPNPSQTAIITLTFTPTKRPTQTRTPKPSPTPRGYFLNNDNGLAFTHPVSWEVFDEGSDFTWFLDDKNRIFFLTAGFLEDTPSTLEDLASIFADEWKGMNPKQTEPFNLVIGGSIEAQAFDVNMLDPDVGKQTWRFVYYHQGHRGYLFVVIATPTTLTKSEDVLQGVWDSISLFSPQVFGLLKDETVYLLGEEPYKDDLGQIGRAHV